MCVGGGGGSCPGGGGGEGSCPGDSAYQRFLADNQKE